jgi:cell division protein FtsB
MVYTIINKILLFSIILISGISIGYFSVYFEFQEQTKKYDSLRLEFAEYVEKSQKLKVETKKLNKKHNKDNRKLGEITNRSEYRSVMENSVPIEIVQLLDDIK